MMYQKTSRRSFVLGAGLLGMAGSAGAKGGKAAASDKVRVAVLGVHGRGRDHIAGFESLRNAEVVALCDPDRQVLADRAKGFQGRYGRPVKTEQDLRRILDDKEIDAVSIATPNHWHALATIWACQAGKDVYVEKPGSHNVFEGRKMVEAAQKYGCIVQHGVQLRSSPALREAVGLLRGGVIGKVYMARALVYRWRPSIGTHAPEPAPSWLDYGLWLGPAQERPFSRRYVHYNWHWHWDFGNGEIGNQGVHEIDMCSWGLGVGLPSRVSAAGGKFVFEDDKETPEVLDAVCSYQEEGKEIQIAVRHWCTNDEHGVDVGNIFYGSEGYMLVKGYNAFEVYLGKRREAGPRKKAGGNHFENFIDVVRSRDKSELRAPVETAHSSSALAHLANISYRLQRQLVFDPKTERFQADEEANRMLTRDYRAPFTVPQNV